MAKSLTAIDIAALSRDGSFRVDNGLYLRVQNNGAARSWLFRYKRSGKTRWMGLGSARLLTLTEAKRKAITAEKLLLDGTDPLIAKRKSGRPGDAPSFKECAESYLKAHEPGWANPKHRYQWRATLEQLAYPEIGKLPVDQIDSDDIMKVLEPIWLDRIETAKRLRGRIEKVLDWAKAKKYCTGENPAAWKGNLSHRLAAPPAYSEGGSPYCRAVHCGSGVIHLNREEQKHQRTDPALHYVDRLPIRRGSARHVAGNRSEQRYVGDTCGSYENATGAPCSTL